jgi:hypothetical protein
MVIVWITVKLRPKTIEKLFLQNEDSFDRKGSFFDFLVARPVSWDDFWPMELSCTGCAQGTRKF